MILKVLSRKEIKIVIALLYAKLLETKDLRFKKDLRKIINVFEKHEEEIWGKKN